MMRLAARLVLSCVAAATAPAVSAQLSDGAGSTITVIAPEVDVSIVERRARSITPPPEGDYRREPLARFKQPLCPGVIGLTEELAVALVDRMRSTIATIGAAGVRSSTCGTTHSSR